VVLSWCNPARSTRKGTLPFTEALFFIYKYAKNAEILLVAPFLYRYNMVGINFQMIKRRDTQMAKIKAKRILGAALAAVLIGAFPVTSLADDLVLESGSSRAGIGWDWDGGTLDLGGIDFNETSEFDRIVLPSGSIIRVRPGSMNNISNGVFGQGSLTINGDGSGELNVAGGIPDIIPLDFVLPPPAIFSAGQLDIVSCRIRSAGFVTGIGTDNGGIRIANSIVETSGFFLGISADFTMNFIPSPDEFPEYGIEIVNSTVKSQGYVLGSDITLSGCEVVEPDSGHAEFFEPLGVFITDQNGNPAPIVVIRPTGPEERYSVSYHPNWALCEMPVDMNRYYKGEKVTLASGEGLTRPGYEFAGWELADGTPVTEPFIMGESDVTLFATWKAK
jgi:uncharacterized repeat protein (TIGR02543 family)